MRVSLQQPNELLGALPSYSSFCSNLIERAIDLGIIIKTFHPENEREDNGGFYDATTKTVYVNATRSLSRQASVAAHECQHAMNLLEKEVMDKNLAVCLGMDGYINNFLRDESRAFATSFIFAHESGLEEELNSPVIKSLFSNITFTGADATSFEAYANSAMQELDCGALGYKSRAEESFKARSDPPKNLSLVMPPC